ncbi:MAG: FKBP-type peptidyl-prolyl cis-trans isomerase N-terminal domain-containing protein [Lysobacteraceae bacterium]
MKLRLLAAIAVALSAGTVVAQDITSERGKLSYAIGYEIGRELSEQDMQVDIATVIRALQDGHAQRDPSVSQQEMAAVLQQAQEQAVARARAEYERVAGENRQRADRFLAENRARQGVTTLPSGIQYRVIEQGNGARPTAQNNVRIHYRVSLSTGQEFASTYSNVQQPGGEPQPVTVPVAEAIVPGLVEVLPLMNTGSRWEIFLPPDKAFGENPRPIGPNQVVIFDLRLVGIE